MAAREAAHANRSSVHLFSITKLASFGTRVLLMLPRVPKWSTLGSGRAPVFCSHRACRGHAHTENCTPHRRTCVRFLFSEEGSLRRSIVNLPAYRLSRSRIPLTPTCERLGMCRSNATKGIEHTDVSYKRPEGPPKPPLLLALCQIHVPKPRNSLHVTTPPSSANHA